MPLLDADSIMGSLRSWLYEARTHHEAGQLTAAEALYRQILSAQPSHIDALYLLGTLYVQQGAYEEAIRHLHRALALQPAHAEAHTNLGSALQAQGKSDDAMASYERAVALQPDFAEAHYNFGNLLKQQGHLEAAMASYERAVVFRPDYAKAHNNLGTTLKALGKIDAAAQCFHRALELLPTFPEAYNNLGAVLLAQDRLEEAAACFHHTLELDAAYAEAHNNLGNVFREQGDLSGAIECFRRALRLRPRFPEAHNNLGVALQADGRQDEAVSSFTHAVELEPTYAEAHFSRATLWLAQGNLEQGWPAYEWRLKTNQQSLRPFPQPFWNGSSLAGRTILVHAEQGVGDSLMFASCFPDLIDQAGHVVLECDPRLASLFTRSFPTATVHDRPWSDDLSWLAQLPPIDVQMSAGSLPRYVRPALSSFPSRAGFLVPDAERQARWVERLTALGPGLKVGIAWRSLVSRRADHHYTSLAEWGPVFTVPGVHFVNLQYDDAREEIAMAQRQWGVAIHAWDDLDLFNDFDDMAALIAVLDLVIAPNMTVTNLAGSVGQRVWRLTIYGGSWDMLGTKAYPWFPSIQVWCQPQKGDWSTVLTRVARDLDRLVHAAAL